MTNPVPTPAEPGSSPTGEVRFTGDGQFLWECPTCGRGYYGVLADEPRSGWDEPRWQRSADGLSLTPSLACQGLRDGPCSGHWWYRDGRLVAA